MNISFFIPTLGAGGAERVASLLCNQWVRQGHSVNMVTLQSIEEEVCYPLDERIVCKHLDLMRPSLSFLETVINNLIRILSLSRALRQTRPDVVVSFLTEMNVNAIIASRMAGVPIVVSERIHPQFHRVGWFREMLRKFTYPKANCVVVQTRDIQRWFTEKIGIKTELMPNPVDLVQFSSSELPSTKRIVSVGRLVDQKAHEVQIKAFSLVAGRYPDWTLHIYGEGDMCGRLLKLIEELGLEGRVYLEGRTDKVADVLRQSEIYAHSARYEGFPNAIVEACAVGRCVVATNAPGATGELVSDMRAGILSPVDDVPAFANNLDTFLASKAMRHSYGQNAKSAVEALDVDAIAARWIDVLERQCIQNRDVFIS